MNPALTEKLAAVAAHAATLGHGEKAGYLKSQQALFARLGIGHFDIERGIARHSGGLPLSRKRPPACR